MKKTIFLLLPLFFFSLTASSQKPDSVRIFIDSALNIMQRHSMFSSTVNWSNVRDTVSILSKDAKTYNETVPALRYAFNKLGDKHGWLVIDNVDYRNNEMPTPPSRINENMKLAASKGPKIYSGNVAGKYAYISIPFFGGQTLSGSNEFAQRVQDSLCTTLTSATKGIIIDLRLNAGGNTFAMIAGLSNVFGNQTPPPGKSYTGDWTIQNYGLFLNDTFHIQLKKHCGDYSKLPVALIIGPQTGSAGELLALGFAGRKKTILIGERTAGYTSGNNGFLLPGNENGIVVAEDYAVDKNGKMYKDGIDPAIEIIGGDDFFNRSNDKKVKAAIKWLNKQQR